MVVGKVAEWISKLEKGNAVVLNIEDMHDSAKAYTTSGIFDHVRPEYVAKVADEVNSEEYPDFELWERPDGRWTLERRQ